MVHRIPGLMNVPESDTPRPPILFQHGILSDSDAWITHHPEVAPAFVAATAGYDIWLGNSRGNKYSTGHATLDPKTDADKYWDFGWQEMGWYDNIAVLKYITELTNQKSSYVAHSQGTTAMFYGLAMHEEDFAPHLNLFIGLSPVTKLPNTISLIALGKYYEKMALITKKMGLNAIGMDLDFVKKEIFYQICDINEEECVELLDFAMTSDS